MKTSDGVKVLKLCHQYNGPIEFSNVSRKSCGYNKNRIAYGISMYNLGAKGG